MNTERFIDTPAYDDGWTDGYYGYGRNEADEAYDAGYDQGQDDREQEIADAYRDDIEQGRHDEYLLSFDPVDQGYYDDDPNPYHGDYSEM